MFVRPKRQGLEILKRYQYHVCPICDTIYSCGTKDGCCNGQSYPCPNCALDHMGRTEIKKITICQFHFFPFCACRYTLLVFKKKKWNVYMVHEKRKLQQVLKALLNSTGDYKRKDFKIVPFNESHRHPAIDNHRYRIALTDYYDTPLPKSLRGKIL